MPPNKLLCVSLTVVIIKGIKLNKLTIFVLFFIGIASGTNAQSISKTTSNTLNSATVSKLALIEKQNTQLKESIQELKIKNESLIGFQSSLLSTVYWSLGFLGSITALLVGFGWWSNFRVHEKDKENLKSEIKSLISEFESEWNSSLSESRREDNLLLEKRTHETKNFINKQVENLKPQIANLGDTVKVIKDEAVELNSKFERHTNEFDKQKHKNMYELRYVEIQIWKIKGLHGNVLLTQVQAIDSAVNFDGDQEKELLEQVEKTLDNMIKIEYQCSKFTLERANESMKNVKGHDVLVNRILTKLEQVKVKINSTKTT